jgi:hypothetical protein
VFCTSINAVKTLKVLAVCLLILALPVQGFAAVSQAFCHAQKTARVQHAESSAHVHEHEHAQASGDSYSGHRADATSGKRNHTCANCAQCCAGYAMVFFEQPTLALMATDSVLVERAPVLHGIVAPRTLERPPRPLLV